MWGAISRHPIITTILVVCTVAGAVTGLFWPDTDWSAGRRFVAGVVSGFGVGYLITATRMLGAYGDEE